VTSYIESAAGAEEGGRTGLTAITVAGCFVAALVFHPLLQIIPAEATAPALVIIGLIMLQNLPELKLTDFPLGSACILTVILMPLTFSISEGLAIGFVVYAGLMLGAGRCRELSLTTWVLAGIFLLHLIFR
jgi:adenine/guanine/hypoxanthine permease